MHPSHILTTVLLILTITTERLRNVKNIIFFVYWPGLFFEPLSCTPWNFNGRSKNTRQTFMKLDIILESAQGLLAWQYSQLCLGLHLLRRNSYIGLSWLQQTENCRCTILVKAVWYVSSRVWHYAEKQVNQTIKLCGINYYKINQYASSNVKDRN